MVESEAGVKIRHPEHLAALHGEARQLHIWLDGMSDVIKLSSPLTREFWEVPILFESATLLAINKPPLLLTSPDRNDPERPNLMKLLHQGIAKGAAWARQRNLDYLMNVHRPDFETSGVLLLTKSRQMLVAMANLFGSESIRKTYVALVEGRPPASFQSEARIGQHPHRPGVMRVDQKHGKRCQTSFQLLEQYQNCAILHCIPRTGRTHQIRVHLRFAGFPIIGDAVYGGRPLLLSSLKSGYRLKGNRSERPLIATTALHAERLSFVEPGSGQTIGIDAPWPKDLVVAVKYLRRYAAL